jgi:hypothetical protein
MQEMKVLINTSDAKINYNDLYKSIKMEEEKESMIHNSLGENEKADEAPETRLYCNLLSNL